MNFWNHHFCRHLNRSLEVVNKMICHRCEELNPRIAQRTNESTVWATAEPSFLPIRGQTYPQTAAIKPPHQLRPYCCWGAAQSCLYFLKMLDFSSPPYPAPHNSPARYTICCNSPRLAVAYRDIQKSICISWYVSTQGRATSAISPFVSWCSFAACLASVETVRFSPFQQCDLISGSWPALCTFIFIVWVLKLWCK